jgi:UPF0755 protein
MADSQRTLSSNQRRLLILVGAGIIGVLLVVLAANVVAGLVAGSSTSVVAGEPVTISVTPGSPASTVYRQLADAGVVPYSEMESATRSAEAESKLQPGTYQLVTGMDAGEVLRLLLEGGTAVDSRAITIVEGWTVQRILEQLAEATEFTEEEFTQVLETGAVVSGLLPDPSDEVTELQRWEGLLYPARYEIPVGVDPAAILQNMADEMVTRFDADRVLISSVIHNRLNTPMRLQIDATVIYALGSNAGQVSGADLQVDSPYNTYRNDGLPPTPIGTVSDASLDAALRPADTDYLFYVLAAPDGSHAFAETYEDHQRNVEDAKAAGVIP